MFTVTYDQFIVSLVKDVFIYSKQNKRLTTDLLMVVYMFKREI